MFYLEVPCASVRASLHLDPTGGNLVQHCLDFLLEGLSTVATEEK